ncbi:MAG: hypothetical protein KDK61_08615 [Simkania sp.]|nr:hypothetical protein [Nanoarchaeota archaeon]MCB1084360.1 hypothetical protein [Simkania sp.]
MELEKYDPLFNRIMYHARRNIILEAREKERSSRESEYSKSIEQFGTAIKEGVSFSLEGMNGPIDLDTYLGEYNFHLYRHIVKQTDHLRINMMIPPEDISSLDKITDFSYDLVYEGMKYIHLNMTINQDQFSQGEISLPNIKAITETENAGIAIAAILSGAIKKDYISLNELFPELTHFEQQWYLSLERALAGIVGFPGYEFPRTKEWFFSSMKQHSSRILVGTKDELQRYKAFNDKKVNRLVDYFTGF